MATQQLQFVLPREITVASLMARLQSRFDLQAQAPVQSDKTYLDTADGRLQRCGGMIEITHRNDGQAVTWFNRHTGQTLAHTELNAMPQTAQDLPATSLRQRIEPIVEGETLLPLLDVRMGRQALHIVDEERKIVLRLAVERYTVQPPVDGKARKLRNRVRLIPVQGYTAALNAVADFLREDLALAPVDYDLLDEALYNGKPQTPLSAADYPQTISADLRMDIAAKILLRQRLDLLQTQEAGIRRQTGLTCLHDFRVAVRHSRALLTQIRSIFPERMTRRFRDDFTWLNRISGPARDRDVMLAKLSGYRDRLPTHLQDTLAPLQDFWEQERQQHYQELVAALDSPRYRRFVRAWRRFLTKPVSPHPDASNAPRPAGEIVGPLIRRAYKKFLRRGETLIDESSAEDLHRLRKNCKRLRYLLDLFQPLLPERSAKLGKKVKTLQDDLGNIHDLHVQTESLRRYLAGQEHHSMIEPQLRRAIAWLVADLEQQQQYARDGFAVRLRKFSRPAMQQRFARLYRAAGP